MATLRILVVDDDPLLRDGLAALIRFDSTLGSTEVTTARDGQEAMLRCLADPPDLVVMDIRMPRMDGIEAARRITADNPDIKILALTTFTTQEYVAPMLAAGASGYLVKDRTEELIPAIRAVRRLSDSIPISIDTTKADVARQALDSGADIINDISGLRFDPGMAVLARERGCEVVIMHMKGTPRDMQLNPQYRDVVAEIMEFFQERIQWAADMGIDRSRLILDPGIGFGKTVEHNLTLLREAGRFKELGCRVLVGHSRKSFIGKLLDLPVAARDNATAALSCLLAASGVDILRVHDVGATRQAVELAWAVTGGLRQE